MTSCLVKMTQCLSKSKLPIFTFCRPSFTQWQFLYENRSHQAQIPILRQMFFQLYRLFIHLVDKFDFPDKMNPMLSMHRLISPGLIDVIDGRITNTPYRNLCFILPTGCIYLRNKLYDLILI